MKTEFEERLRSLINNVSRENGSNTPDFILARYMLNCLEAFEEATLARETWYGRDARSSESLRELESIRDSWR